MAVQAIIGAVVFGAFFGIGKLSDHGFGTLAVWAVVEFFRAIPVLLLMVFIWYALGTRTTARRTGAWSSR